MVGGGFDDGIRKIEFDLAEGVPAIFVLKMFVLESIVVDIAGNKDIHFAIFFEFFERFGSVLIPIDNSIGTNVGFGMTEGLGSYNFV